ncbi:hypothetical protein PUNSTDRAFT_48103 [Punctularia strigosozonata HHB-11173 SS5]|uniref:Uncharacterized protein n=1 Tax=Punctularia strigosozonata (strain HHB-11173) TaxID=741275 RepID=R7S0X1_PUNST|nr:uncharacterized protein PUNSTDRAFT_48103 [Punctularia strigosozonata HHB-11173 SS5]EIN03442.1 hypothetical protein PUNSTDRAFT_48103 [Punctularia strigosozonata HHB-11173 SS5]
MPNEAPKPCASRVYKPSDGADPTFGPWYHVVGRLVALLLEPDENENLYGCHTVLIQHLLFAKREKDLFGTIPATWLFWVMMAANMEVNIIVGWRVESQFTYCDRRWRETLAVEDLPTDDAELADALDILSRARGGIESERDALVPAHPFFLKWENRTREVAELGLHDIHVGWYGQRADPR